MFSGNIMIFKESLNDRKERLEQTKETLELLLNLLRYPKNYSQDFQENHQDYKVYIEEVIEEVRKMYNIEVQNMEFLEERLKHYNQVQLEFKMKGY